jgi:isopentenyl diphosphate isomerase/L-lactate dehydrogenase-like FMN-dependent dehydrogenase
MNRAVTLQRAVNVDDLRSLAQDRLPRVVFDYLDGGAEDEITMRTNRRAFEAIAFRPRQAVSVEHCDLRTRVLNTELSMPAILAPVGYSRLMHSGGEVSAVKAAGAAGTAYVLSTISGYSLEDVKSASSGPVWYQLYLLGGRDCAEGAIERARNAGFSVLVLTVDTAVSGMRERDLRNGIRELMGDNPLMKLPFLSQFLSHPRWLTRFLMDGGLPKLQNVVVPGQGPMSLTDVGQALAQTAVKWQDLKWIRAIWRGPIAVKGIMTAEDACVAVDHGANAIIVSNHGGRQLDGVSSSLSVLPEIVSAVGDQAEVLMDGGIRRGSDIAKALCLGAKAVLIGRAYAYGLAAAGQEGVARTLEILRADVERTLKLLGCRSVNALNTSHIKDSLS